MEIDFALSTIFEEPVQRLDRARLMRFNPSAYPIVQKTIDDLGWLSKEAQGLKRPVTSYEEVLDGGESNDVYILWRRHPSKPSASIVDGMVNVDEKLLYLFDSEEKRFQENTLCILDFYIHDSVQRKGYGRQLLDYVLMDKSMSASNLAIQSPTDAFLLFLKKYYRLRDPIWQSTKFVVFPEFFDGKEEAMFDDKTVTDSRRSKVMPVLSVEKTAGDTPISTPPRAALKDSVGGLLRGNHTPEKKLVITPNTPLDRKNRRDFGHHTLW